MSSVVIGAIVQVLSLELVLAIAPVLDALAQVEIPIE
jgi:hypothetical protein